MELAVLQETRQNTKDIAALAATVDKLATVFQYAEKAHEEDRKDLKEITTELRTLNEKLSGMNGVQKELGALTGEVGKLRHDLKTAETVLQAVPLIKESLVSSSEKSDEQERRIDGLEKWKERTDGAAGAVRVIIHAIWAFVSIGGLGFIGWIMGAFNGRIGGE